MSDATSSRPAPRLAFFGDDFTGSTDALEFLTRSGARTALFIEPPTPKALAKFDALDAVGVAGLTRSLAPEPMETVLRPAFEQLRALGIRHLHYKVCSTFDSSPSIGSIGRAIEVGRSVFPEAPFVPIVVGAPALGRYCIFGNLFARMGIGSNGAIYRLDRHPSASRHPTTPADEADLLRHLARQTPLPSALFDYLMLSLPEPEAQAALARLAGDTQPDIVLFDLVDAAQLERVGALLEGQASAGAPLFSVGSSGVEMALGALWQKAGELAPTREWPPLGPAKPLLVLSGSQSPVTSGQLHAALEAGFTSVPLDTAALARGETGIIEKAAAALQAELTAGHSVILHTSLGKDDPRLEATAEAFVARGMDLDSARAETGELFGRALGTAARLALTQVPITRMAIAGGDSSSFAARALGIEAVEMVAPFAPGAPLCRATAPGSPTEGIELNFKGGQVGSPEYCSRLRDGSS